MKSDEYQTVEVPAESEIKIKSSRFIGYLHPVNTPDEAMKVLETLSRRYYDASHHCYAYRIGEGDQALYRFSDDGEPAGTAGKPILQALQAFPLTNVILIVTRYFGGTKLGTGGLIRAYGQSAEETIQQAKIVTRVRTRTIILLCTYTDGPVVTRLIHQNGAQIEQSRYEENIAFTIQVRLSAVDALLDQLKDSTCGRIQFTMIP